MRTDTVNGDPWDEDVVNGVAVELNAKQLGFIYDVTDEAFGAIGDGTNDDTVEIQAAIDAAYAAGGGTVFLPAGIYKISAALRLKRNVSLLGDGADFNTGGTNGSRIRQVTAGAHGLYSDVAPTAGALEVRNLVIESTAVTGTAHGIYLQNNSGTSSHPPFWGLSFRDLMIIGFTGYGFNAESIITSVLERVTCMENGHGFYLNGAAYGTAWTSVNTSVVFNNCYANGNTGIGWHFLNTVYCALNACAADSNSQQYVIDGCNSLVLNGCGAEYASASAPAIGDSYTIKGQSNCITLNSCMVLYNQHYGLYVTGNSYSIIALGFVDSTQGTHAVVGLKVDSGSFMTDIGGGYTGGRDLATNSVTVLDDGVGNMGIGGEAYFNGTVTAAGHLIVGGDITMTAEQALYAGLNKTLEVTSSGGANYLGVESAATGNGPDIFANGSDSNIDIHLIPKGTGRVKFQGDAVMTTDSVDIVSNKTLSSPKIPAYDAIYVGTAKALAIGSYGTAVNHLGVEAAPTTESPDFYADGTDTNIDIRFLPKGAGKLRVGAGAGNPVMNLATVPSTATSTGVTGQMAADASWLYICTATNTWRRVAIASW